MIQNIGLYAYQYNLNEVWQKTSYWNQNVVEMLLIPTVGSQLIPYTNSSPGISGPVVKGLNLSLWKHIQMADVYLKKNILHPPGMLCFFLVCRLTNF